MDGALAAQIQAGRRLKKTQINDRSAPIVPGGPAPMAGARPGAGLASAPRPPGLKSSNGAPKLPQNGSTAASPPQLGGLFAGGMPTLKKTNTAPAGSIIKAAPPVPKPPTGGPPSRAAPPAPQIPTTRATPSRLPPPVPPQTTSTRVPPPPPVTSPSTSSRPPPVVPPQPHSKSHLVSSQSTQKSPLGSSGLPGQVNLRPTKSLALLSPTQPRLPPPPPTRPLVQQSSSASPLARTLSVGHQSRPSSNPPAPPPRPHTSHVIQPPLLPSRPGARAAPPPPPPRTTQNSPTLGGSLNRKAPPPPPRPSLPGNSRTLPEIHAIERSASTPPGPPPPPSQHPARHYPAPPARLPPPVSLLQQLPAPNFPADATRPISLAPGLLNQSSPPSAAPARSSVLVNRSRVLSTPTAPDDAAISRSSFSNGSPRARPKSMIIPGTLAHSSNRPPSPPTSFSINPPRNFPPSNTFPPPRKFQSGITHQYPSTKKRGCDWDYKAVLA